MNMWVYHPLTKLTLTWLEQPWFKERDDYVVKHSLPIHTAVVDYRKLLADRILKLKTF